MGIWGKVRSLWENEEALKSTAESLLSIAKKMRIQYPERDLNAWLAWALSSRTKWGHLEKQELCLQTTPCSILDDEQATDLLALTVVSQEYPEMNRVIAETQHKLYLPIDFAIRNGTFLTTWKQKNPWTDENFPAIEQDLKQGLLAGAGSRKATKVHITCPQCKLELRIPSFTGGKKIRCPNCKTIFSVNA